MEKVKAIIAFEYMSRVRRPSFLLVTFISPLLSLLYLAVPVVFLMVGSGERDLTVLDQSGVPGLYESIKKKVEGQRVGPKYVLMQVVVAPDQNIDQFRLKYNAEIEKDSRRAYIVLRPGILDGVSPEYYSSGGDFMLENIAGHISLAILERKLMNAGLNPEQYVKPLTMKTIKVSASGEAHGGIANFAASFVIFMFTFLAMMVHAGQVMNGIVEEKSTRIIEVMVSSATPSEMMTGKLLGIGMVGLTQYLLWVIAAVPLFLLNKPVLAPQGIGLNSIPITSLLCLIAYFMLGYFLFASMYLVGGALVTDNDSNNIVTRIMMLLIVVPFMTVTAVLQNPNGVVAMALTFIPFFTPGTMVLRMVIAPPPLWQILLSMSLLAATTVATTWAAAKIYRIGILIYGKKPNLVEIVRWLRYA